VLEEQVVMHGYVLLPSFAGQFVELLHVGLIFKLVDPSVLLKADDSVPGGHIQFVQLPTIPPVQF
jgi:hypothetical protein